MESDTTHELALSSFAERGSKTSALRPTSCTGQASETPAGGGPDCPGAATLVLQIMWWKTKRPPTVCRPLPPVSTSLNSLISSAATYRSSVSPVGVDGISPHQSGALPFTVSSGSFTIKSGVPIVHDLPSGYCLGAGISAGFPRGAPASAHLAIIATSSSLSDGSFWYS